MNNKKMCAPAVVLTRRAKDGGKEWRIRRVTEITNNKEA